MNAAATQLPNGVAPATRHPHASPRQLVIAIVLLAVGGLIAWFTIAELSGGPTSFTGSVYPLNEVNLDFAQTGRIGQLMVKAGDHVTKGQVLATQDTQTAQAGLADAQAVLTADRAKVAALTNPALSAAEKQNLALQVSKARSDLAGAQQASSDAIAQANSKIAQAQQLVDAAVTAQNADNAQFAADCQGGTSGSATQTTVPSAQACSDLQAQLTKDAAAVTSARANLDTTTAAAAQLRHSASSAADSANASLQLAENQLSVASQPATAATVSAAQADLANAQAAVDQATAALAQMTLTAPVDGIVAQVGGIVGDLDGNTGVHRFGGPHPNQTQTGPAFSLFPQQAGTSSNATSTGNEQPLIWIVTAQYGGMVQVDETAVGNLRPGHSARVTVNALNATVDGSVTQIEPIPVDQSGTVQYQVRVAVSSWPAGTLPGMSLSVTFP